VAGIALACAGVLLIVATRWATSADHVRYVPMRGSPRCAASPVPPIHPGTHQLFTGTIGFLCRELRLVHGFGPSRGQAGEDDATGLRGSATGDWQFGGSG